MSRFEDSGARTYDERIKMLIPGYELLHLVVAEKLKFELENDANILVLGAGTGKEILALSEVNPSWRFTAVDVSSSMLDIAKMAAERAGIAERITFVQGTIESVDTDSLHDAALCLFVTHFVSSITEKQKILSGLCQHLLLNGKLIIADLMKKQWHYDAKLHGEISKRLGLSFDKADVMVNNLSTEFYPLADEVLNDLASNAGFGKMRSFFQVGQFKAFQLSRC